MSAKLRYSQAALEARPTFFRASLIVAVEDEDDKYFWQIVLRKTGCLDGVIVEPQGGLSEVLKLLDERPSSRYVVARDRDYDYQLGEHGEARVLITYGHSIENTLCAPVLSSRCLEVLKREVGANTRTFFEWLERSVARLENLACINATRALHPPPLQRHPGPYLVGGGGNRGFEICERKIRSKEAELASEDLNSAVDAVRGAAATENGWVFRLIPGHFLFALLRN